MKKRCSAAVSASPNVEAKLEGKETVESIVVKTSAQKEMSITFFNEE